MTAPSRDLFEANDQPILANRTSAHANFSRKPLMAGDLVRIYQGIASRISSALYVKGYKKGASLVQTFSSRVKEVDSYGRIRQKTKRAAQLAFLDLGTEHYAGWAFHTKSKGKVTPETFIENPIICFPGDTGLSDTQEVVNVAQGLQSFFKQRLPEDLLSDVTKRLLSFGYKNSFPDNQDFSLAIEDTRAIQLIEDPKYCGPQAQRFIDDFFIPRIFNVDDQGVSYQLNEQELSRRLRMTMVGSSVGGPFIRQILNGLEAALLDGGYSREEIDGAFNNIFALSIAGNEPFGNPHHNSGIRITDIKDPVATKGVHDFGIHPLSGGSMYQTDGSNNRIIWVDHAIESYRPHQAKNTLFNPYGVGFSHSHFMNNDRYMPDYVADALLNSALELRQLPSLDDMYEFDVQAHKPDKIVGKDAAGYSIYEEDILLSLASNGNALDLVQNVHDGRTAFKNTKDMIAAEISKLHGLSGNKSKAVAGTFIQRVLAELEGAEPQQAPAITTQPETHIS